jgi:AmmeMemoRadiSam system protein B
MSHAGSFYPRFGEQILAQLKAWTEDAKPAAPDGHFLGLVVPHAGYIYSGRCAALGFLHISRQPLDALIVLHPCHHAAHFDYNVSSFKEYETPFGNLELDLPLYEALLRHSPQEHYELFLHEAEHSMEVQLPLLKHFLPEAKICPVMIGRQNPEVAEALAEAIFSVLQNDGRDIGIVVSTDLSHYHPAARAEELDSRVIEGIRNLDPGRLWQDVRAGACEACGIGGVLTLLYLAAKYRGSRAEIVDYTHSGASSGNYRQVVGYLSAAVRTQGAEE